MIKPFSINIPQHILDDLKMRLEHSRWPNEIENTGWQYGTNLAYLKSLSSYWLHTFNWRKVEAEINAFPNFMATIDGHKIHFLHIKAKQKNAMPLIITHGWPGSFLEMMKLIPLLADNNDFAFDLVIPSVIGFGFSEKITVPGCNSYFIAGLWNKLMLALGYKKYGAQGGDIGAGISTWLALKHPQNITGLHLNYIPGSYQPFVKENERVPADVQLFRDYANSWSSEEGAYAHQHSSKPLTLAYGLNDSPVGLCAWILEKFNSWSDNNGHVENVFTKEELLANITLYWVTQTIYSSVHIYYENRMKPMIFNEGDYIKLPVAFAQFPKELPTPPRLWVEKGYNIRRWTEMPAGGHFAAMEQPQLLAKDIVDFFSGCR